ncbi:cellulose binding domain-containing protein [Actinosynnema sp. NPDC023658]|uniref:cellulose binding domain-containing protein n=1 Tax=Actinosynnema sp. NPDC023658 TaxID=3155465 RepID=UPI0034110A5E
MGPLPPNLNYACRATTTTTAWPGSFNTGVTVTNTGSTPITDWTVVQVFYADEKVSRAWNAESTQYLNAVVLSATPYRCDRAEFSPPRSRASSRRTSSTSPPARLRHPG